MAHRDEQAYLKAERARVTLSAELEAKTAQADKLVVAVRDCLGCIGLEGYVPSFGEPRTTRLRELVDGVVIDGDIHEPKKLSRIELLAEADRTIKRWGLRGPAADSVIALATSLVLDSAAETGDAPPLCAFMVGDEICAEKFPHSGAHVNCDGLVLGDAASETKGGQS